MIHPEGGELFTIMLAGALGRDERPGLRPGRAGGAGKPAIRACPPPLRALTASLACVCGLTAVCSLAAPHWVTTSQSVRAWLPAEQVGLWHSLGQFTKDTACQGVWYQHLMLAFHLLWLAF